MPTSSVHYCNLEQAVLSTLTDFQIHFNVYYQSFCLGTAVLYRISLRTDSTPPFPYNNLRLLSPPFLPFCAPSFGSSGQRGSGRRSRRFHFFSLAYTQIPQQLVFSVGWFSHLLFFASSLNPVISLLGPIRVSCSQTWTQ